MNKLALPAVATALLLAAPQAHALLIDDFNDASASGLFVIPGSVLPIGPLNQVYAGAIGGSRTYQIVSGDTGDALFVNSFGALSVTDAGGGPSEHRIIYDANGFGLGGLDLTDSGTADGISFDILFIDQGATTTTVTITDSNGLLSALTLPPGTTTGVNKFFFNAFTGTADFTDVDSVVLNFQLTVATDLVIDLIETTNVPVPASLLLVGVGLVGLGVIRRRA